MFARALRVHAYAHCLRAFLLSFIFQLPSVETDGWRIRRKTWLLLRFLVFPLTVGLSFRIVGRPVSRCTTSTAAVAVATIQVCLRYKNV
ncbi:hypothetical protein F5Y08DRAFT_324092 [Xylaria arbuscula]|nr:hypothetical protein F5Y08DRAFT_324092 [Xylaria arbuscula]